MANFNFNLPQASTLGGTQLRLLICFFFCLLSSSFPFFLPLKRCPIFFLSKIKSKHQTQIQFFQWNSFFKTICKLRKFLFLWIGDKFTFSFVIFVIRRYDLQIKKKNEFFAPKKVENKLKSKLKINWNSEWIGIESKLKLKIN